MTKKAALKKRRFLRNILGAFSFTTALFVFEACYGPPMNIPPCDCQIEGRVRSVDNVPLVAVDIRVNGEYLASTNSDGYFGICTDSAEKYELQATDGDRVRNGFYETKDTILFSSSSNNDFFSIELVLTEK
jgi:hypothetical protein